MPALGIELAFSIPGVPDMSLMASGLLATMICR